MRFIAPLTVWLLLFVFTPVQAEDTGWRSPEQVEGAITIALDKAKELHAAGVPFIDVRSARQFNKRHIPGAHHLYIKTHLTEENLSQVADRDDWFVVYCNGAHCPLSSKAIKKMVPWGFKKIYYFRDGFRTWRQAGNPIEEGGARADLTAKALLDDAADAIPDIGTFVLEELLKQQPETVVIDVRSHDELAKLGGMIDSPNSYNIPRGWLEFRMPETVPDKKTPIVVYCGRNERSPLAALTLKEMGYRDVKNYADGFFVWRDAGLPVYSFDRALDSFLYREPQQVAENVWSAIGATQPRTYENTGHNNNLSFVITSEGVLVMNAGDNYLLAQSLHAEIRKLTDQPVRYVVLENGQGHAMLGTDYWQKQGATVIAQEDALHEIEETGAQVIENMRGRLRDKSVNTVLSKPDETFSDEKVIEMGGTRFEIRRLGPAHSPGDISVWMPKEKVMIAGDIAFHQRMLPVFDHTDTAAWLETWETFESYDADIIIPGHGDPTDMATVTRDTKDYLVYLRGKIAEVLDEGGDLQAAYNVDQTPYKYLHTYRELARLNAEKVFRAMEFE